MTEEEKQIRQWLADWYDWCWWLERQPRHCSYRTPDKFLYLQDGAISSGMTIYHSGWGWRLRKNWFECWRYLCAEYLELPIGAPFGEPGVDK